MQHRIEIGAILAVLVGACGTEPQPDVTGTWNLTASYAGGSLACALSGTLTLTGSGATVTGNLEDQGQCTDGGTSITIPSETQSVSAAVEGRTISFTPQPVNGSGGCALLRFDGGVSGDEMSGTVETIQVFCQGTYTAMQGTWEAQRQ